MDIIFATKNKGKLKEIKEILDGYNIISIEEAGIEADVIEDGDTFEHNAIKKAREIMELTGKPVLSDDSGLEIDYLEGAPGVYSADYMGRETPYQERNERILDMMKDVPNEKRGARFVCVIAAAFPGREIITARQTVEGRIAYKPAGENGFGYDPIFFVPEYKMNFAELTSEMKNQISHRGKALREMKSMLINLLNET